MQGHGAIAENGLCLPPRFGVAFGGHSLDPEGKPNQFEHGSLTRAPCPDDHIEAIREIEAESIQKAPADLDPVQPHVCTTDAALTG